MVVTLKTKCTHYSIILVSNIRRQILPFRWSEPKKEKLDGGLIFFSMNDYVVVLGYLQSSYIRSSSPFIG